MPTFKFTSPEGKTYSVSGPEGATQEQAFQILQQQLGGGSPAAPEAPKPTNPDAGVIEDVGASVTAGNAQGAARAIGFPGDMASLAHAAASLYTSPPTLSDLVTGAPPRRPIIDAVKAIPGAKFLYDHLPTTKAVTDFAAKTRAATASPGDVPLDYVPNSTVGQLAQTGVSNATTGLMTGAGIPGAVGMGVGGAAGKYIGGDTGEAIGSLAGGITAPVAMAARSRRAMQALKDAPTVKAEANASYAEPLIRETQIAPQATTDLAGAMRQELQNARSRFSPAQAKPVYDTIDELAQAGRPISGIGPRAPTSIEDLHSLRKTLGEDARKTADFKPTEGAVAAGRAKRVLDQYLDNLPSKDVVKGNPIDAVTALRTANANWGAQSNAKKVGNLIDNALIDNAGAHSAMNKGNKIRQSFKPLLKNDAAQLRAMGYGDDVINAVRTVNKGDFTTNALRYASNALGGGGGLGSLAVGHMLSGATAGALGYKEGGFAGGAIGTLLGMAPGQALRLAANARTLKNAKKVQEALLAKAPANARIVAANRAARASNKANMMKAVNRSSVAVDLALARLNGG